MLGASTCIKTGHKTLVGWVFPPPKKHFSSLLNLIVNPLSDQGFFDFKNKSRMMVKTSSKDKEHEEELSVYFSKRFKTIVVIKLNNAFIYISK